MNTMRAGYPRGLAAALVVVGILLPLSLFASAADEDPIVQRQLDLFWRWKNERQLIETDCSGYRTTMGEARYAQATPYVECSMEHFRALAINWGAENYGIVELAMQRCREQHLAIITDEEMTQETFDKLVKAATYTHTLVVAWHQRLGDLLTALVNSSFMSQQVAGEILTAINTSLSTATADIRAYIDHIRNDQALTRAKIRELTGSLHEKVFAPAKDLVNKIRQALLSEKDRTVRYYTRELERDQLTYEEIMKHYIGMLDAVFLGFQNHSRTVWIQIDVKDTEGR